jgi:hypothetical protein
MSRVFTAALTLLASIFLIATACNKSEGNENLFYELEGRDGISIFKIPVLLFNGIASLELKEGDAIDDLGDIEIVKVLVFDQKSAKKMTLSEVSGIITAKLTGMGYEELLQVSASGIATTAFLLDNGQYISDLMVVITEGESIIGIGLSGRLDINTISKFASGFDYSIIKEYID